jgi:DNA topoisomerase I
MKASAAARTPSTACARAAGLDYSCEHQRGIHRYRHGKGFIYRNGSNRPIRDVATLQRIYELKIPPAWTDVWICPSPRGHLQATGRDARRRKQYRYHSRWTKARDDQKYRRLIEFAHALPRIRRRVARDLALMGLPQEKVLATIVRLMDRTQERVGNDEYARANGSYGLTTLEDRHVDIQGSKVHFRFRGKSGVVRDIELHDKRLAKIVRECRDLKGQELFQYRDEQGQVHDVNSRHVNDYLRSIVGGDFTAKDFRTWAGTLLAVTSLRDCLRFESEAAAKRNVVAALDDVAQELGNTRAVCRKSYVHPGVLEAYVEGRLTPARHRSLPRRGFSVHESDVLQLLVRLNKRRPCAKRAPKS